MHTSVVWKHPFIGVQRKGKHMCDQHYMWGSLSSAMLHNLIMQQGPKHKESGTLLSYDLDL